MSTGETFIPPTLYESPNLSGLILPGSIQKTTFTPNRIRISEKCYTQTFDEASEYLNELYSDYSIENICAAYLGFFQNPYLSTRQVKQLWDKTNVTRALVDLWSLHVHWREEILEFLTHRLIIEADILNITNTTFSAHGLWSAGAYPYWTKKNCHLLIPLLGFADVAEAFRLNDSVDESVHVMVNLIATELV